MHFDLVMGIGIGLTALAFVPEVSSVLDPTSVGLAWPVGVVLVVAGSLTMGFVVGAVVLLPPLLCAAHFDSGLYGRVYGLVGLAFYAGGGLGPALAGGMRDAQGDYIGALTTLAAVSVAAAIVVLGLRDPEGNREAGAPP